jgi:hypothetical protein
MCLGCLVQKPSHSAFLKVRMNRKATEISVFIFEVDEPDSADQNATVLCDKDLVLFNLA